MSDEFKTFISLIMIFFAMVPVYLYTFTGTSFEKSVLFGLAIIAAYIQISADRVE